MWRKTPNAPEKDLSSPRRLSVDATYLSLGRGLPDFYHLNIPILLCHLNNLIEFCFQHIN